MFGIRLQNTYLDLAVNTAISYEMYSPLYFGDDIDVLQGSIIYTLTVPNSPKNAKKLRHPNILDNAYPFIENADCDVLTEGSNISLGKLTVINARRKEIDISISISANTQLKDSLMSDIFKETTLPWVAADVLTHSYATCRFPLDYPYVFHPLFNEEFNATLAASHEGAYYQNAITLTEAWVAIFGSTNLVPYTALTPFFRLEWVLENLFKNVNYSFSNQFQTNRELKQLTMYNNCTLVKWTNATTRTNATAIKVANHMPDIKAGEWLKNVARDFNLGAFYKDNHVDLIPAESLLDTPSVQDWTDYLLTDITVSETREAIRTINFEENSDDLAPYKRINEVEGTKEFKPKYMPPIARAAYPVSELADKAQISLPDHKQKGSYRYFDTIAPKENFSPRLMFYRGLTDSIQGSIGSSKTYAYPRADSTLIDAIDKEVRVGNNSIASGITDNDTPALYTLTWDDSNSSESLYNRFWKRWNEFLKRRRLVKARFNLPPALIAQFRFQDKIRVQNREYFVKKLRFSVTRKGVQAAEAELVAVIA